MSLDRIHVEIAVAVVIEQTDAGRHDLGDGEPPAHAVDVCEHEPAVTRPLDEPGGLRRVRPGCRRGWARTAPGERQDRDGAEPPAAASGSGMRRQPPPTHVTSMPIRAELDRKSTRLNS